MPDDVACLGLFQLFDSTHPADHIVARAICETCPALAWCRREAHEVNRAARDEPRGAMQGTWAGRLYGATAGQERVAALRVKAAS